MVRKGIAPALTDKIIILAGGSVKKQPQNSFGGRSRKLQRPGNAASDIAEARQRLHSTARQAEQPCTAPPQATRQFACPAMESAAPRYEVHMPECTCCEAEAESATEHLQGLDGLSLTETFSRASVLITGATGYIGSLVRG